MHWCRVFTNSVGRCGPNLNVSKPSHHRVHIKVLGLSAAESGYLLLLLLTLKQRLSFLASLVLFVKRRALLVATDVLFNHFLFFLIIDHWVLIIVISLIRLHSTLHRRELPVQIHWRLALIVEPAKSVCTLIIVAPVPIPVIVGSDFEIFTCAELL